MKKTIKFLGILIAMLITTTVCAFDTDENGNVFIMTGKIFFEGQSDNATSFSMKTVNDKSNAYAFCIDRDKAFVGNQNVPYKLVSSTEGISNSDVRNVLIMAYSNGLGTESNTFGITNDEFYQVTQIAVWYAAHRNEKAGVPEGSFATWLDANNGKMRSVYNTLVSAIGNDQVLEELSLNTDNVSMHLTDDKKYYVSDDIVVNGAKATYTITTSDNACVLYNGKCEKSQTITTGENFKLRADNNSEEIEVSASIKSEEYLGGYEFGVFVPNAEDAADNEVYQRVAGFRPYYNTFEGEITATVVKTNKTGTIKVSKTDATGQEELDGAEMKVYEYNGTKPLFSWTSKKGEKYELTDIVIGQIYRLEEVAAPEGYDKLTTNIYFMLNTDGKVVTCKNDVVESNAKCEAMSSEEILNIKNYPTKNGTDVKVGEVTISKKDFTNGEEIPGAHLQIKDAEGNVVAEWTSTDVPYEVSLPVGKYVLIEILPATNYKPDMIIDGNLTTEYEFEITENGMTKIDVYNELNGKTIDVPITGMNVTGMYIIGGLVTLAGASVIVCAKKKENM